MSQQAFYFDGTRCTGCKTCQMACKDYKNIDLGISFRHVYEVTIGDTVKDADGILTTTCVSYPLSMSCNHCDSPICFEKCPQSAIIKDADTGLMSIDEEKCIGCGTCAIVCPYNAPKVDEEKKKAVRCNGCAERVAAGEKSADRTELIKTMREYAQKKLPKLTQSESFRSESTKRRVIMFLNYHGLESVSQFILKTKAKMR